MAGKKGCTGRALTKEAKEARARAGRARWGTVHPGDMAPGAPGQPPTPLDDPLETIADHDRQIGRPVTWPDALKRLQMIEQSIINEKREVELEEAKVKRDLARGQLLTIDAVKEREQSRTDLILAKLSIITDAAVNCHPPEQQPHVRHLMDRAVAEFRKAVAEAIRDGVRQPAP